MSFNLEVRKKQLESLDQYITSSKDKVHSLLKAFSWDTKALLQDNAKVSCPLNQNHKIFASGSKEHAVKCYVKTLGYDSKENFLAEPKNCPETSIKIEHSTKIEILTGARFNNPTFRAAWNVQEPDPMTSDRLYATYSPDERLAFYNYCVQNTKRPDGPGEFNFFLDDDQSNRTRSLTHGELLSKERDAKRRRIKYKPVHTSKSKSYTETVKEVIESQMSAYESYLAEKSKSNGCLNATKEYGNEDSRSESGRSKSRKDDSDERRHGRSGGRSGHGGSRSRSRRSRSEEKREKCYGHNDEHRKSRDGGSYDRKRRERSSGRYYGNNKSRSHGRNGEFADD